ncbi:pyridoxal-phosphate dependent enzyme [Streptomyces sp. IBTA2]|uniref:pyridoxal-phosphate dependent enzyme n=1 Tax=Streptomyces sp. IBTA2 TaxID=2283625 RepID=UPI0010397DA6|nr:pyridoxal-phosphate dependent enzyme [Streptomyces sp. IBTA2]
MLLKAEHLQKRGGSFKARGAAKQRSSAGTKYRDRGRRVLPATTASPWPRVARRTGASATVVMAAGAGRRRADAIRRLGARV